MSPLGSSTHLGTSPWHLHWDPAPILGPITHFGVQHPFLDVPTPSLLLTLSPVSPPSALPPLRSEPPHGASAQDSGRGGQGGCPQGTQGHGDTATHATVPNHSVSLQTPDNVIIKQVPVSSPMKTGIFSLNHNLPEVVRWVSPPTVARGHP